MEIETGKSDFRINIKNALEYGYEKILVIGTSYRAMNLLKKEIDGENERIRILNTVKFC